MNKNFLKSVIFLSVLLIFIVACSDDKDNNTNPTPSQNVASCEGCHTNYDHLKKVADPYVEHGGGGCGGDVPRVEPYDAVYLGGAGFQEFKNSKHYSIGCVGCHKGVDKTDDKKKAHSGDFIAKPSILAGELCGGCHNEETKGHTTNIHNGFGQMRKVTQRYGLAGAHEFNLLPKIFRVLIKVIVLPAMLLAVNATLTDLMPQVVDWQKDTPSVSNQIW